MKYLLTSTGIKNQSIYAELVDLIGKPISECSALCVPTGIYPFTGGSFIAHRFLTGSSNTPSFELGWKKLGVLELTALPSIKQEIWLEDLKTADALIVFGGDVFYLHQWMRRSGVSEVLTLLQNLLYIGISAGSMVTGSLIGETYQDESKPFVIEEGLGLVNFAMLPHFDHIDHPESSMEKVSNLAAALSVPLYAIDDQSAISVNDDSVRVISEGQWKFFPK